MKRVIGCPGISTGILAVRTGAFVLICTEAATRLITSPEAGSTGVVAACIFVAFVLRVAGYGYVANLVFRAIRGIAAEVETSRTLASLIRDEEVLLNDIPLGNLNADHVLVSPHGVFVFETKSYGIVLDATVRGGRHLSRSASKAAEEARFVRWRLLQILKKAMPSVRVSVRAVVVTGAPGNDECISVGIVNFVSRESLPSYIESQSARVLPAQIVERIAVSLEKQRRLLPLKVLFPRKE
jgi:hypothetical protein